MGFWSGIGKLASGKPVFDEDSDDTSDNDMTDLKQEIQQDDQLQKTSFVDEHGNKIVPQVAFKKFKSHIDGSKVTTWVWAKNTSPFEVELMRAEVPGYRQEIRRILRPNEEHEIKVYDGPAMTNDHDHHARLYLKIHENDDLFLAEYEIEYNRESDGTFTLEEFHHTYQPRDI